MAQIAPNSSGGEVIITPSPPKQAPSRKNHFITWFYSDISEIAPVIQRCKELTVKGIAQTEICPNTKRPHIHLMLWGKDKFRDTQLKIPKNTYNGAVLKDYDNISNYANKDESHDGVFRDKWGFPKPLKLITPDKWWQVEILKILDTEPDDRTVHWYWSEQGGLGKSQFAKYCVAKLNCLFFEEGKKSDIMHLIFEAPEDRLEKIIIDVPRDNGNNISYKAIESIKNGMIYSPKYEGGYKLFNSPHIIVFANQPPQEQRLSPDRWRITQIDHMDQAN